MSCPHHICPHHLLQQLLLLLLLLWCVVLPLARTGVVVVEELGQSWVHWHRLHGRRHGLEQRGGGAVLGVTIVSGAAQLQLYHGAHIVGVHTEEQLRQLLQFCVGEGAGGSPALFVIVRAAVAVLGTLGVALAGQGGVVPGTALALAGALGALRPVVRAAVGVCLAGRVTLTREAAVEGILNRGVRWRCSDIATLTSTLWHFDIVTLWHVTMWQCEFVTLWHCYIVTLSHCDTSPSHRPAQESDWPPHDTIRPEGDHMKIFISKWDGDLQESSNTLVTLSLMLRWSQLSHKIRI